MAFGMAGLEFSLTGGGCSGESSNNILGTCLEAQTGIGPLFAMLVAVVLIGVAIVKHPKGRTASV